MAAEQAQLDTPSNVVDLCTRLGRQVEVRTREAGGAPDAVLDLDAVDAQGLVAHGQAALVADRRFVWLTLHCEGRDLTGLGEVERAVDPAEAVRIRWKHLFPDARRQWDDLLAG